MSKNQQFYTSFYVSPSYPMKDVQKPHQTVAFENTVYIENEYSLQREEDRKNEVSHLPTEPITTCGDVHRLIIPHWTSSNKRLSELRLVNCPRDSCPIFEQVCGLLKNVMVR